MTWGGPLALAGSLLLAAGVIGGQALTDVRRLARPAVTARPAEPVRAGGVELSRAPLVGGRWLGCGM